MPQGNNNHASDGRARKYSRRVIIITTFISRKSFSSETRVRNDC